MKVDIIINYPDKGVERWLTSNCSEHRCQDIVINRFLRGDLWTPSPIDTQAWWKYQKSLENFRRGYGEVFSSYFLTNEWQDTITWDCYLNYTHTILTVDVFVKYWGD